MSNSDTDTAMRSAAFAHIKQLIELRDALTANDLKPGFQFGGVRIPLINPQRNL
jgi:putative restriction endonuclease